MIPIYQQIERIRKEKGVQQTHLARACGKSPQWYQGIKSGKNHLKAEDFRLLVQALEVDPSYFFTHKVSETLTN